MTWLPDFTQVFNRSYDNIRWGTISPLDEIDNLMRAFRENLSRPGFVDYGNELAGKIFILERQRAAITGDALNTTAPTTFRIEGAGTFDFNPDGTYLPPLESQTTESQSGSGMGFGLLAAAALLFLGRRR